MKERSLNHLPRSSGRSHVLGDTSWRFRSPNRWSITWRCSSSLSAQPFFLWAALEGFTITDKLRNALSIKFQFIPNCVMVQHMMIYKVWPWGYWVWTESHREVQLCCDLRGSASCRKVTCEGCRALHDDKHGAYQNKRWQTCEKHWQSRGREGEPVWKVCATFSWSLDLQLM